MFKYIIYLFCWIITKNDAQLSDFICPEKFGRYPTTNCDAYVECTRGVAELKVCPDGLLFRTDGKFGYPCGYPIEVDCEGRSTVQEAQPTNKCQHQYGYYRSSSNCGEYVNCAGGVGYVFQCPLGLVFNEDIYQCDYPEQVSSCDINAYLGFTCPESSRSSYELKYYSHPEDCQRYYSCINGRPRLYSCDEEEGFNAEKQICEDKVNVTSCDTFEANTEEVGLSELTQGNHASGTNKFG